MSDIPLSLPRRFVGDLLHAAGSVPLATAQRRMCLREVAHIREQIKPRPGWSLLFTKGYALVAQRRPVLRRLFVALPRPRLYEHPHSVATVSIQRYHGSEPGVFFAHLIAPEERSLTELKQR